MTSISYLADRTCGVVPKAYGSGLLDEVRILSKTSTHLTCKSVNKDPCMRSCRSNGSTSPAESVEYIVSALSICILFIYIQTACCSLIVTIRVKKCNQTASPPISTPVWTATMCTPYPPPLAPTHHCSLWPSSPTRTAATVAASATPPTCTPWAAQSAASLPLVALTLLPTPPPQRWDLAPMELQPHPTSPHTGTHLCSPRLPLVNTRKPQDTSARMFSLSSP